jgi:hypothetical protein
LRKNADSNAQEIVESRRHAERFANNHWRSPKLKLELHFSLGRGLNLKRQ